jgi:hypothetical protein
MQMIGHHKKQVRPELPAFSVMLKRIAGGFECQSRCELMSTSVTRANGDEKYLARLYPRRRRMGQLLSLREL